MLDFIRGFIYGLGTGTLAFLLWLTVTEGPEAVVELLEDWWPK